MSAEVRVETLESLSGYHDDLGNGLNWSSIFVLPVWLQAWWAIFGEEYELSLHSVWQDGELIGIAPLMRRGEEAFFLAALMFAITSISSQCREKKKSSCRGFYLS
jgi:hypothetical protein